MKHLTSAYRSVFRIRHVYYIVALVLFGSPCVRSAPVNVVPTITNFTQIGPGTVELVYAVKVGEPVPAGYTPFVQVVDKVHADQGVAFQIGNGFAAKPEAWPSGQTLASSLVIARIPAGTADGIYDIRFGLYDPIKGPRLELMGNDDGQRRYTVGTITVAGDTITMPGVPAVTPAQEGRLAIVPSVTDLAQAGPYAFSYRLDFDVHDAVPAKELIFDHFTYAVTSTGHDIVCQIDPGIPTAPETWSNGQKVTGSLVNVTLPSGTPDGDYTIRVGLYSSVNGIRVKLTGHDDGDQRFIVARVSIANHGSKITFSNP